MYQEVARNPNISVEAKGIYCYLSTFCGCGNECFPQISLMCQELGISKTRLYKHMKNLEQLGVVEKTQTYNGNLKGKVVYKLTHTVTVTDNALSCFPVFPTTGKPEIGIPKIGIPKMGNPQNEETNNNSFNNNSINNNSIKKERGKETNFQMIVDLYNEICVSFPRVTKLSESRKKAIKARLKQYSVEDFKELFRKAEESDFLKGQSNLNWSANFDWLIRDTSMVKVLEGYYRNGEPKQFKNSDSRKVKNLYDNEEYEQLRRERQQKSVM